VVEYDRFFVLQSGKQRTPNGTKDIAVGRPQQSEQFSLSRPCDFNSLVVLAESVLSEMAWLHEAGEV
jgi:hypothetical protein